MSNDTLHMNEELRQETFSRIMSSIEVRFWRSETFQYAVYGAMFGFLFPVIATLLQAFLNSSTLTWEAMVAVQKTDPLVWIIDSAPFWLGLFAAMAGRRQDNTKLIIRKLVREVPEVRRVLDKDEARSGEAGSFASFLVVCGVGLVTFVMVIVILWLQTLIMAQGV